MTPVEQTRLHIDSPAGVIQKGNCYQACIASIMDLPLDSVPNFIEYEDNVWYKVFLDFIEEQGYEYSWQNASEGVPEGYAIGSGISPRARKDKRINHAVVVLNGVMVHDPHPDKTGVVGGFYLYETFKRVTK